jgi:hypothetical protein
MPKCHYRAPTPDQCNGRPGRSTFAILAVLLGGLSRRACRVEQIASPHIAEVCAVECHVVVELAEASCDVLVVSPSNACGARTGTLCRRWSMFAVASGAVVAGPGAGLVDAAPSGLNPRRSRSRDDRAAMNGAMPCPKNRHSPSQCDGTSSTPTRACAASSLEPTRPDSASRRAGRRTRSTGRPCRLP